MAVVKGFAPPAFSYDLRCVNASKCTHYSVWTKYIACIPASNCILHHCGCIQDKSHLPTLNGFVLVSQMVSLPLHVRLFLESTFRTQLTHSSSNALTSYHCMAFGTGFFSCCVFSILLAPTNEHSTDLGPGLHYSCIPWS